MCASKELDKNNVTFLQSRNSLKYTHKHYFICWYKQVFCSGVREKET